MSIQAKALTALVAAAAAGLVWYVSTRPRAPEGSPTEAATDYLRRDLAPLQEGPDYTLASMQTIRQAPGFVVLQVAIAAGGDSRMVHLRIDRGDRWRVAFDYEKSFRTEVVESDAVREDLARRYAQAVADRFHKSVNFHLKDEYPTAGGDAAPEGDTVEAYFSNWNAGMDLVNADGGLEPVPYFEFTYRYYPPGSLPGGKYRADFRLDAGRWVAGQGRLFDAMPARRLPH